MISNVDNKETKIILLNFSKNDAAVILGAGFCVERGFLGRYRETDHYAPFYSPHPLYEYDILIYNSYIPTDLENEFVNMRNLGHERGSFEALSKPFRTPPVVRIAFIGEEMGTSAILQGGVPFIRTVPAESNVSSFIEAPCLTFGIEPLHKLLVSYKTRISQVAKFTRLPEDPFPIYHHTALATRSGQQVISYGTTYDKGTSPRYVVLPQLKDRARAVVEILECLLDGFPALFPGSAKRSWLSGDEFLLPEERRVQEEITRIIDDASKLVDEKQKQGEALAAENSFVRELLIATEDSKLDPAKRLSSVVKKTLEFLGWKVIDIDAKTKSAIKKEDFWIIDDDFLAITEVTATIHKNPKIKEFNDILGRMATIYKRKGDLKLPTGAQISGLLILNYDIDNHPSRRPRMYSGDEEHLVETAIDQGIGLLSTVDLYRMTVAVKEGALTKNEVRDMMRKPGRIEMHPST